jgi:hypothetical protein
MGNDRLEVLRDVLRFAIIGADGPGHREGESDALTATIVRIFMSFLPLSIGRSSFFRLHTKSKAIMAIRIFVLRCPSCGTPVRVGGSTLLQWPWSHFLPPLGDRAMPRNTIIA